MAVSRLLLPFLFALLCQPLAAAEAASTVVLLHGLVRSADAMEELAAALEEAGYTVCNVDYPSRQDPIEILAVDHVLPVIQDCAGDASRIDFVTHSLGGIIVRYLEYIEADIPFGRVVMLGPPNGGSEVVDQIGDWPPVRWLNGPAGTQLGTGEDALPQRLGPTNLELGVIAGSDSINLILSQLIPGDDDGKVSLDNTQVEGMDDHLVVPVSHPFLVWDDTVIDQTIHFLRHGRFDHSAAP